MQRCIVRAQCDGQEIEHVVLSAAAAIETREQLRTLGYCDVKVLREVDGRIEEISPTHLTTLASLEQRIRDLKGDTD